MIPRDTKEEAPMRQLGFVLTLMAGIVMAAGTVGGAQEASGGAVEAPPDGVKLEVSVDAAWYEAYKWERDATYEYLMSTLLDVSGVFRTITELADLAMVAPDAAALRLHVQEIVRLLGGPQEHAAAARIPGLSIQWGLGYRLLGEGGQLEQFTEALDSYLSFVEACSGVLVPYDQAKFRETYGPEVWPDYDARYWVEDWLSDLRRAADEASTLARLALDAALGVNLQADVDGQTDSLVLIFACAAAAGGYSPVPSPYVVVATPGETPVFPPDDPELWYTENVPSVLWSLLRSLKDLDQELADAFAAGLASN